ncbi:hypothetical protein B4U80_05809 [Leptotrombidium deliense]|uniref:Uncharacterized protein n=1 Tax=Leptotrombidium deliense TaxID=299467 RepID=A0A443S768_9ACAR|nr:hypothetical protein B4U80_05809 [Leptotrombidium deliense]
METNTTHNWNECRRTPIECCIAQNEVETLLACNITTYPL